MENRYVSNLCLNCNKIQKTEQVVLKVSYSQKNTPFLYFEGKNLVGYIELSADLIKLIKEMHINTEN